MDGGPRAAEQERAPERDGVRDLVLERDRERLRSRVTRIIEFCHTTVAPPAAAGVPCAPASSAADSSNAVIFALISVLLWSQPLVIGA